MVTDKQLKEALLSSYEELHPASKKYRVDFDRYFFSLRILLGIDGIKGKKVLDIGTGIGLVPLALKKLGINASGIDYYIFPNNNNEMFAINEIDTLKEKWQEYDLDIQNKNIYDDHLPWPSGYFDIALSEATIEHLKDPKKFVDKCHDFLSPGGIFLLTTPNIATLLKRIRFLLGRAPNWPVEEFYKDGEDFTGHWREYTMSELTKMCELSNFKILKTYNKNVLARFKNWRSWKKNLRALLARISNLIPGTGEMNYVLCKKK